MIKVILRLTFILLGLIYTHGITAQEYLDFLQDDTKTFEEKVKLAEAHFDIKGRGKHSGYKLFKRWEYHARRSLDSNGFVFTNDQLAERFNKFASNSSPIKSNSEAWTEMGPLSATNTSTWSSHIGRITNIAIDPNDIDHILVSSPGGGIWKTLDEGDTWIPLFDDKSSLTVYSVNISHADSDVYLAGTSGLGIQRSIDGGITWSNTSGEGGTIFSILQDPSNSQIYYAGSSNGRVYKSTNGGQNWTSTVVHFDDIYDLEFKPGSTSIIYAAGRQGGVYKSIDSGATWNSLSGPWNSNRSCMMAVTADDPNYLYVLQESGGGFGGLYLSTNEGTSFTTQSDNSSGTNNIMGYNLSQNGGQAPRDMDVIVNPADKTEVHVAGIMTFKSTNSGVDWAQTTHWVLSNPLPFVHADIDQMIYFGSKIYVASDGGIFISSDGGDSFIDKTTGLGLRQFYRISASLTDEDRVAGGSQDNGTGVVVDGTWYDFVGADGMEPIIMPGDSNTIIASIQFGGLYKSINGGQSNTGISQTEGGDNGEWVTPLESDPIYANTIYQGKTHLYKSTNEGGSWSQISNIDPPSSNKKIDEIRIAPNDNQTIYLSYSQYLYKTTNGGETWDNITPPNSNTINYIDVHKAQSNRILISKGGSNRLLESTDGGETWTNITHNLPNMSTKCAIYDNTTSDGIYVALSRGVYFKNDSSPTSYSLVGTGLPNASVEELQTVGDNLYAATYGRGLWKIPISGLVCELFANASFVDCFSQNTLDSLDDTYTFSVNPVGLGLSSSYSISGDISASNILYANPYILDNDGDGFGLFGPPVQLTVTDNANSNCSISFEYSTDKPTCFSNYTCETAQLLNGEGTFSCSGPSEGGGANNASATNAIWYKIVPEHDGLLSINSCLQGTDTRVYVYKGNCSNLSVVASNDDSCPMTIGGNAWASEITNIPVQFGTVYYIEWDDRWSGSAFDFTLELEEECLDYYYADVTGMGFSELKSDQLIVLDGEVNSTITTKSNSTTMRNTLNVLSGGTIMIEDAACDYSDMLDWKVSGGTNTALIDNSTTTINLEVGSEASSNFTEIAIKLDIDHEDISQLIIDIKNPTGHSIRLWNSYCSAENSIDFIVSETGDSAQLCGEQWDSGGRHFSTGQIPETPLSAFYDSNSVGTWEVSIEDTKGGSTGTVNEISLYFR